MEPTSEYQAGKTRPQQRHFLIGGLVLLVVIVTGVLVLDRSGTNDPHNRVRDETHVDPPTPPR
ncbi:MAG TPA: hypothetical protein VJV79_21420 [Polyangiaceae bacterium]|nr:hypothetical protein [Polyangiaceae bacterium]